MNQLSASTQKACNDLMGSNLVVDGDIGPKSQDAIKSLLDKLKYIYSDRSYVWSDSNLIGVRMSDIFTDEFTDYGIITMNDTLYAYPISTKPGSKWLENPENPDGCACMLEGQYSKMWTFKDVFGGWTGDPYCQQINRCAIIRQKDKKVGDEIDRSVKPILGNFGINYHTWKNFNGSHVFNLSAGCTVMSETVLVGDIHDLLKKFPPQIDYTLLHKNNFA